MTNFVEQLNYLICDDEPSGISVLKQLLNKEGITNIIGLQDPIDALNYLLKGSIDVAFLDIKMPILNGLDLAAKLSMTNTKIIFVTAYEEFAVRSYQVDTFDYLTKPVSPERLRFSLNKLKNSTQMKSMSTPLIPITPEYKLIIREKGIIVPLSNHEITLIEAADKYSVIKTFSETYVHRKPLSKILNDLQDDFIRIHRSTIINRSFILRIESSGRKWQVITKCGKSLDVSESYRKALLELFN